jgi:hypothetical protein
MKRYPFALTFVGAALLLIPASLAQAPEPVTATASGDTVHVAPPTGEKEADRASILAALAEVQPGGTVQFGPGTYVIGSSIIGSSAPLIEVTAPGVTLLGHPQGTTLRGCDPHRFSSDDCYGLELTGGHQTVRDVTFEYFSYGLNLGGYGARCTAPGQCAPDGTESLVGGYLVEGNTFRSVISVNVRGQWQEPAVIRRNTFTNVFHAVSVIGGIAHVLENDVSVTDHEQIPFFHHAGGAISVTAYSGFMAPSCDGNVIAGNRVVGHPESINIRLMELFEPASCRDNVIRDNTVVDSRIPDNPAFPYASGAILLVNETGREGLIEGTLIEGNRIVDSHGVGVAVFGASRNRIVDNSVRRLGLLDTRLLNERVPQDGANGSGIWIGPGSDGNEIVDNTFEDIAAFAVVLDGDGNEVVVRSADDTVRDLGSSNRVSHKPEGQ